MGTFTVTQQDRMSRVKYFQSHNCLDHVNTPELNEEIDQQVIELLSMTVAQQNENYKRVIYHRLHTG